MAVLKQVETPCRDSDMLKMSVINDINWLIGTCSEYNMANLLLHRHDMQACSSGYLMNDCPSTHVNYGCVYDEYTVGIMNIYDKEKLFFYNSGGNI